MELAVDELLAIDDVDLTCLELADALAEDVQAVASSNGIADSANRDWLNGLAKLQGGNGGVCPVSALDAVEVNEALSLENALEVDGVSLRAIAIVNNSFERGAVSIVAWELNANRALIDGAVEEEAWLAFSSNGYKYIILLQVGEVEVIYIAIAIRKTGRNAEIVSWPYGDVGEFSSSIARCPLMIHIAGEVGVLVIGLSVSSHGNESDSYEGEKLFHLQFVVIG